MAPKPSGKTSPKKPSKKEDHDQFTAEIAKEFQDTCMGMETSLDISFDQALLFDESMLNSWFQEKGLPIKDRALLLQRMRQYKHTFAHQSTEAIESELTTKMLFDALLFAVAFTVPTGVDRAEMQEAWIVDDAIYNVSKTHLGTYEVILLVMTFLVTTSTGLALIVGFTIYSCLRYERPSSIEEADKFYTRFQAAFRLSYGFTYLAILLAPFSCLELHFIKSSSEPTRLFFNMYGFILYGGLIVFLIWSLRQARRSRAELLEMREDLKNKLLKKQVPDPTQGILQRSLSTLHRSFSISSPQRSKRPTNSASPAAEKQTCVSSTECDDPLHSA